MLASLVFATWIAAAGSPAAIAAPVASPAAAPVTAGGEARPGDEAERPPRPRRRVARPVPTDTALVTIGPPGVGTRAFVAFPPGSAAAPSVVVVHEWWGLNAQIRELAQRLARQGYVAIVPDLYHGRVAGDPEAAHTLSRALDEDSALNDLAAVVAWLRAQPRTAARKSGVIGFCMGGRLAQWLALRDRTLAATVVFYGAPETRPERLAELRAPLQGHFGAEDAGIDTARVEAFRHALAAARKPAEIYVYPGAGHAFMNQEQQGYRPEAARLAWVRMLDFLQKHLKGVS